MDQNQAILDWVERLGGGYVWEPGLFAVTMLDVALDDETAAKLCRLSGVRQIVINADGLSFDTLRSLAGIPGLRSLVLAGFGFSDAHCQELSAMGPDVELIDLDQD